MKNKLSIIILVILFTLTSNVNADQELTRCEMVSEIAANIANDRDQGISYNAELGKLKGAAKNTPNSDWLLIIGKSAIKTVYNDLPKITPKDAYKFYYEACTSLK